MARNISVRFTNWHATDTMVPVDQYELDVEIRWISATGEQQEHIKAVRFPDILRDVPRAWLKRELENLMLWAVMKKLGIDQRYPE